MEFICKCLGVFFDFGGSIIQWMKTIYYVYVRFNGLFVQDITGDYKA